MNTLLDNLADHLQGDTLTQLSRQVGANEEATSEAIAMALPMLVSGQDRNASTPAGANSLEQALAGDHDGSLLQNISVVVQGRAGVLLIDPGITGAETACLASDLRELGQPVVAGF